MENTKLRYANGVKWYW